MPSSFYTYFGKRLFDIIFSFIGLVVLFPLFIIIAMLIKLGSSGPLFFLQTRAGKDFKPFKIYKFRSMIVNADKKGPSVSSGNDKRITKIGRILRKTKMDELPQLLNVFIGDMSLVGPRPEVFKFVEKKEEDYKAILAVKPGITDNAAIEFRNEEIIMNQYEDKEEAYLKYVLPEKIKLYNQYINNITFFYDLKLILKTIKIL